MLHIIVDHCYSENFYPNPLNVYVDFESAIINAVKSIFDTYANLKVCYFHLALSVGRYIQKYYNTTNGLEKKFYKNNNLKLFCGVFMPHLFFIDI